ncbi:MAG TPA: PilZ domain-containing protein [Thiotrichales bacterium]|nr:PilZ domain-containing protein [Thiotrichales bacterium]
MQEPRRKERREFYRIDDFVLLEYERVDEEGVARVRETLADRVPDRFTVAASFETSSRAMSRMVSGFATRMPELARYLRQLDQKLNHLARLFVLEQMNPARHEPVRVNLSAGGLVFPSEREYGVDERLRVRLALLPEALGILAVARVVHCERLDVAIGDRPWQVAVEFEHIRESDRDLICSHIMHRDAELRRERREAEENGRK